ncbi:MAG: hypothetical protein DHS20C16_34930 [Phycisphaerae bacterium]|nr:MAG: hypothetical protein DHS20C16_34930 [Phycisphaerae bacterium]
MIGQRMSAVPLVTGLWIIGSWVIGLWVIAGSIQPYDSTGLITKGVHFSLQIPVPMILLTSRKVVPEGPDADVCWVPI